MGEFKVRLRLKHYNKLVPIEGGRVLRSQEIRDAFLRDARETVNQFDTMAGCAFVCWNDEGETLASVSNADFSPYEERDIPHVVKSEVTRALDEPEDTDATDDETDGEA